MYVKTYITLVDLHGNEDDYEVGASVEYDSGGNGWAPSHTVSEPEFSAPNGSLKTSRLAADPQSGEVFPDGWSGAVEEALIAQFNGRVADLYDDRDHGDFEDFNDDDYPTHNDGD